MQAKDSKTRCPACETVFAVTPADLAAAGGKVRCGDCFTVFDATAHWLEVPPPSPTDEAPAPPAAEVAPAPPAAAPEPVVQEQETPAHREPEYLFSDDLPEATLEAQLAELTGHHATLDASPAPSLQATQPSTPEAAIEESPAPPAAPEQPPEPAPEPAPEPVAPSVDAVAQPSADVSTSATSDWDDLLSEFQDSTDPAPEYVPAMEPAAVTEVPEPAMPAISDATAVEVDVDEEPAAPPAPLSLVDDTLGAADLSRSVDFDLADAAIGRDESSAQPRLDFELAQDDEPASADALDLDLSRDIEAIDDEGPAATHDEGPAAAHDDSTAATADEDFGFDADALSQLLAVTEALAPAPDTPAQALRPKTATRAAPATRARPDPDTPPVVEPAPVQNATPETAQTPEPEAATPPSTAFPDPALAQAEHIVLGEDPEPAGEVDFAESMILAPEDVDPPTGHWRALAAVALLVLLGQLLHAYRGELATRDDVGSYVVSAYERIGRPVVPAWDPAGIVTEGHGMAAGDTVLEIEADIVNRGTQSPPLPLLRIQFLDAGQRVLDTRVLPPKRYLAGTAGPARLSPGARITARAELELAAPELAQYHLSLCYPHGAGDLRCAPRFEAP